jgi:mRNA interferase HigB
MHVISRKALREFEAQHPDAAGPLGIWYRIARKADWNNLAGLRKTYPHADLVGRYTVFNIKGNSYRLIVKIEYEFGLIFIKRVLTHAECDKGAWKK